MMLWRVRLVERRGSQLWVDGRERFRLPRTPQASCHQGISEQLDQWEEHYAFSEEEKQEASLLAALPVLPCTKVSAAHCGPKAAVQNPYASSHKSGPTWHHPMCQKLTDGTDV